MAVEEQLQPGEEILYRAHPTRVVLVPPLALATLLAAGGLAAWFLLDDRALPLLPPILGIAALVPLGFAAWRLIELSFYEYVLTDRRIIRQVGILNKSSMDSYLEKVNNVEHRQTLWGRILGYGDVEIDTASETGTARFPRIARPLDFKRAILAACDAHRARLGGAPAVLRPSGAERIRELKALLDEGLISRQEYEAKRQRLLQDL